MSISLILKLIPWSLVKDIVFAVLDMVVEDSENEFDDAIIHAAKKSLDKAESNHPDKD